MAGYDRPYSVPGSRNSVALSSWNCAEPDYLSELCVRLTLLTQIREQQSAYCSTCQTIYIRRAMILCIWPQLSGIVCQTILETLHYLLTYLALSYKLPICTLLTFAVTP